VTAAGVELDRVTKHFGSTVAVAGVSLDLAPGSLTALLGPSGCGKSTTLSLIAGLHVPNGGDVRIDRASMAGVPAERRPVGLVFQKPLLFPHLSVADNIGFGLRMHRHRRPQRRAAVGEILERVRLDGLGSRRVGELSGGQEQRVALARALVLSPRVLLLDEPFSQLDAVLRAEMRALLRQLHDDSDMTTVFVTHDQVEAVEVADSIALMLDGHLAGHSDPAAFYTRPPSLAAARFFGVTNEIPGTVSRGQFTAARTSICVAAGGPDGSAVLVIRPESVRLRPCDSGSGGQLRGTVVAAQFAGSHISVELSVGGQRLSARTAVDQPVTIGESVAVELPSTACTVFLLARA